MKRNYGRFLAFFLAFWAVNGFAQTQFTEVSVALGVGNTNSSAGAAWGDYDGDSDLDLFVIASTVNKLYKNTGGVFADTASVAGVSAPGGHTVLWADYDNDSDLDLFVVKVDENFLYRNNANGTFSEVATAAGAKSGPSGTSGASLVDYNNDGNVDLFISDDRGRSLLYRNSSGVFTETSQSAGLDWRGNINTAAWADYDGDGYLDLYMTDRTSAHGLYKNDRNGSFTKVGFSFGDVSISNSWADYDNDGDPDLLILSDRFLESGLFRNTAGSFSNVFSSSGLAAVRAVNSSWADYDNDGDVDLFVTSNNGNKLFSNNGSGTFTEVSALMGVADSNPTVGGSWGDYDNDGDVDLFVTSPNGNRLYRNNGNANRWLVVRLTGIVSNRSAIGARVTVRAGASRQIRDVGNDGSLPVEFGFSATATVDSLIIRWPSGTTQALTGVATNQVLNVSEAVAPTVSVSSSTLDFGPISVGQFSSKRVSVRNIGTAPLTISGIASGNSQFTFTPAVPPNLNLNIGDSVAVNVTYTPTSSSAVSANLMVTHTAVGSPTIVNLLGNGAAVPGGGSTPPGVSSPGVTLLPTSLVMDSVNVGGPGSHKTFEIRNDSTVTLNVSSISVGGANSGEFLVSLNSAAIEAGGRRIVVVSFLPVTAGAKSAVVNISHNAAGGISTLPLTGVASPFTPGISGAAISITPQSVHFDTVGVSSSRIIDVTVSNPGTAPLVVYGIALGGDDPSHFSLSRTNLSVDPGQSRFINVTFRPASVGPKSAVLVLANNTANPALSIALNGTTPVFFAPPRVNIWVDRREGPAPFTVHLSNTNSGGFANYWEWQPGDRNEVGIVTIIKRENGDTLTYIYSQPGVYRPKLAVFGPGGGDAQNLADSIVVLVPQPLLPILRVDSDSLQFGAIDVGGGIVSSFRVFNTGTARLNGKITLDGDNSFNVTSADSFSIPPGSEDRTIAVRFAPLSGGVKSGRLIINYNGETGVRNIVLTGEGRSLAVTDTTVTVVPVPRLDISVTQVDLGSIFAAKDTSYANVVVRNTGTAVLEGSWFLADAGGDFLVESDSTSLAPGLADTVAVRFTPQTAGQKTGRLYFFHNAAVRPYVVNLTGEARQFATSVEMADFDNSGGVVNLDDFFLFAEYFGRASLSPTEIRTFDLNGDRRLDFADFFIFSDFFGRVVR